MTPYIISLDFFIQAGNGFDVSLLVVCHRAYAFQFGQIDVGAEDPENLFEVFGLNSYH